MLPEDQTTGSILGSFDKRVAVPAREGVGLRLPDRLPGHEHTQWYELDRDDEYVDPDIEPVDPLPTERHRTIPD